MKTEYEIRVLEVDVEKFVSQIESLGAKKEGEWFQKRYVFDTKPKEDSKWFRLRTNGEIDTLTYKNVCDNTIDGTQELEIKVSDFEKTHLLMELLGYKHRAYQENKRIRYILEGVEIDIDSWPLIPTYVEFESDSENKINNLLTKLEIDKSKITTLNCEDIYKNVYNIDIDEITELKFNI